MSIAQGMLMELAHEAPMTRGKIERVPDDKLDFKPHEKSMSIRQLIGHIAESPGWGLVMIEQDAFDMNPDEYKVFEPASVKEAVETFDKNIAAVKAALEGKSDEYMHETWKMSVKGNPVMEAPRVAALRGFLLNHMVHHRAQLGVYLRLNDIPLPQIYGPSADEGGMMGGST